MFSEKSSELSISGHYGDLQTELTEDVYPDRLKVVCVQGSRSHIMLSSSRSCRGERNTCIMSVGRIFATLPHHPVRLHDMMQRQAKLISSTMSEFLRSSEEIARY
ncbi:unnamed protein product [Protopolystoma xenopodis]|uniref:Bridge-like lipid transfer protein family member 1 middle region domain-containing protein n=1 Tax=Protopolystoma xenopodis TaxID=117903 RepID=A0A448XJ90_9PLAT|nr:unnamed protein product [Protopolystoma xenopodis]